MGKPAFNCGDAMSCCGGDEYPGCIAAEVAKIIDLSADYIGDSTIPASAIRSTHMDSPGPSHWDDD